MIPVSKILWSEWFNASKENIVKQFFFYYYLIGFNNFLSVKITMKYTIKILLILSGTAHQASQACESVQVGEKISDLISQVHKMQAHFPDQHADLHGFQQQMKSRQKIEHLVGVKIVAGMIQEEQKDPGFFEKAKNYATPMLISAVITSAVTIINKYLLTSAEERAVDLAARKQQIEINRLAIEKERQELKERNIDAKNAQLRQLIKEKAELEKLISEVPDCDKEKYQIMFQKFCKREARNLMSNRQSEMFLSVKVI
jgi:hypothetical protein